MKRARAIVLAIGMLVLVFSCCCCCGGGNWEDWEDWQDWEDWGMRSFPSLTVEAGACGAAEQEGRE